MTVDILGTEYDLIIDGTNDKYPDLDGADGYCNYQLKQIVISKENNEGTDSYKKYLEKVMRHEIIHAYLYESGLHEYASDETIVDWMAIQMPKLNKLFKELNT